MTLKYKICLWGIACTLTLMIRNGSFQHIDNVKDYPVESQSTEQWISIIKPGAGNVQLTCNRNDVKPNRRNIRSHGVIWHYKRCGKGSLPCDNATLQDDWALVMCKSGCKAILDLRRATSSDNGLYRCSIKNKSPTPKTLTTYKLEISDNVPDFDYGPDVDNAPDYPLETLEPPVKIFRPGGGEVELHCKSKVKPVGHRKAHRLIWHYKKCGSDVPRCSQFAEDPDVSGWMIMTCNGKECRDKELDLGTPTEDDNGLYRCSIKNNEMAKIVVTYELEIVDKVNASAEILEGSLQNLTVLVGQPAPFQCRVYSKVKPTIVWLRQRPAEITGDRFIPYQNDTYEQMNAHQISFPKGIYLSKLVVPMASQADAGIYACVAINNVGITNRTAYLTVLPKYFSSNATLSEFEISSLHWLFLIPASLALIPAIVWVCCLWRRRKSRGQPRAASMEANHSQSSTNNNNLRKQGGNGFKYKPVSETKIKMPTTVTIGTNQLLGSCLKQATYGVSQGT